MRNTFVLDTSILLSAGKKVFSSFPGEELVIPLVVVGELESKRNDPELGITARSSLRFLEEVRGRGDIKEGITLENGATIRIEINHVDTSGLPEAITRFGGNDIRILAVAAALGATLLSRDLPLRIKAEVCGVESRDLTAEDTAVEDVKSYVGLDVSDEEMDDFFDDGGIIVENDFPINSNVMLTSGTGSTALGVTGTAWSIKQVPNIRVSNIEGKNAQQRFALYHLQNKSVPVVSLGGRAGSGKSLLALAAGVQQVRDGQKDRVVVFKPAYAVLGGDLGFLPGTMEEKFAGFSESVFDAMEAFATTAEIERMIKNGQLEILPLSHLRGRTLNNSFIILDEAQNLELPTILTVLTRTGKNSKVAITFDLSQIDNLHVGKHQGIYEAVSRMSGNKLFAHVDLNKSERSDVAEMAASLLSDHLF